MLKLMAKALWVDLKSSLSFVLALSVGLVGLSVIFSSRMAIEQHMAAQAREILSADLSVSARRIFNTQEKKQIIDLLGSRTYQSSLSLFTMVSGPGRSKLTYIKAIPQEYPLYGTLLDKNLHPLEFTPTDDLPVLYGDSQFFEQINVHSGSEVQIGHQRFIVKGKVKEDSTQSFRFSALAPKVYLSKNDLQKTGLVGFGSTVSETIYVLEPDPQELSHLKKLLLHQISDSSIRIETADSAAQNSVRALKYLSDYLGLISLVGFLLASLGAGFIFFESLNKQLKVFSIFQSLGLSRIRSLLYLLMQILLLSFAAGLVSFLISLPLFFLISKVLLSRFSMDLHMGFNIWSFSGAFLLAFLSALIMSFSHLWALMKAPMNALLDINTNRIKLKKSAPWMFLLSLLFVLSMSFFLSRSFKISLFFTLGLMGVFLSVGALGVGLTALMQKLRFKSWIRLALMEMNGKKATQVILFSVITLSVLMLDAVKQIEHSLQQQLTTKKQSEIPDYFLFDIQDDQIAGLKDAVHSTGLRLLQPSPMVRAKMLSVNGEPYEIPMEESRFETREEEEEARFRNRGLNLSYRDFLQDGEILVEGKPLESSYKEGAPLQLSVEEDYAKRIDIDVGDTVEMDIQGLPVKGVVTNLRRVSWTNFLPNFFVVTQPGLLEQAPKTWLAGISRGAPEETKNALSVLRTQFPNVSYVDLDEVIAKVHEVTSQMGQALLVTALLVFLAGLFILFSVSRYHFLESRKDLNLLKVLGADASFLMKKAAVEQITIMVICLALGLLGSAVLSRTLLNQVFESQWRWDTASAVGLALGLFLISLLMTFFVFHWSRRTSPKKFLG